MKTPFNSEQFFRVFEKYNHAIFPLQLVIMLSGIAVLFLLHSGYSLKSKLVSCYLGSLWIWTGLVYHLVFFTEINKAAFIFGGIFILQGLLFIVNSFSKDRIIFIFRPEKKDYLAYFFIIFGLVIYPVISYLTEGKWTRTISLGLPCPTTILTFGFLTLTKSRFPKYLLIIPSLWAIAGLSAAINFGVYQDFMMIIAAIMTIIFLFKVSKPNE